MKLALIRRRFTATGGAELYVDRFLKALTASGHELHFFAEQWNDPHPGITFHKVPAARTRAARHIGFAENLERVLKAHSFDCVFSFERTLKQEVYRAGDGVHDAWLLQRRKFAPWWKKPFVGMSRFDRNLLALEKRTFNPANTRHIIVNSDMVKREILERFPFPENRIHLVRNGVDVPRFQNGKRAETRARFGLKEKDFVILFVGSGWERKGLRYALRAVDRFMIRQGVEILEKEWRGDEPPSRNASVPVKFLIVGKGRVPYLTSKDFIFAGSMNDVENAYAAADLFLFTPTYDPAANVVYEAMAAGLPVITTAQNGSAELIEEGVNGTVIADPSRIENIVDAIAYWCSHRYMTRPIDPETVSLERNVAETLRILEIAAAERRATSNAASAGAVPASAGGLPN